jgi:hypothetical protein
VKLRLVLLLAIALSIHAAASWADSRLPPTTETDLVPDKTYRLTVIPRPFTDRLGYFTDKLRGREPAGATVIVFDPSRPIPQRPDRLKYHRGKE